VVRFSCSQEDDESLALALGSRNGSEDIALLQIDTSRIAKRRIHHVALTALKKTYMQQRHVCANKILLISA
jgi:hypothetical protein